MAVTLICPNLKCRAVLQVPDKARGKKVRCGQCRTAFMVPAPGARQQASGPANTTPTPQ